MSSPESLVRTQAVRPAGLEAIEAELAFPEERNEAEREEAASAAARAATPSVSTPVTGGKLHEQHPRGQVSVKKLATHNPKVLALTDDLFFAQIIPFLTDEDECQFELVCKRWKAFLDDAILTRGARLVEPDGTVRRRNFRFLGVKCAGTEGTCCKVQFRGDGRVYAMKKARLHANREGVPYYMLREMELLRGLEHPNVSHLEAVALSGNDLYIFFPFQRHTLSDILCLPPTTTTTTTTTIAANAMESATNTSATATIAHGVDTVASAVADGIVANRTTTTTTTTSASLAQEQDDEEEEEEKNSGNVNNNASHDSSSDSLLFPPDAALASQNSTSRRVPDRNLNYNNTANEMTLALHGFNLPCALPMDVMQNFIHDVLSALKACHDRGVLHRNVKPKHILVMGPGEAAAWARGAKPASPPLPPAVPRAISTTEDAAGELPEVSPRGIKSLRLGAPQEHAVVEQPSAVSSAHGEGNNNIGSHDYLRKCRLVLSDFALLRTSCLPLRKFTPEVVTLWYRAPEVLMGGLYFASVDVWAAGCVLLEMLVGRPFFAGISEVDQLFLIYSRLGTPTEETWRGFTRLPHYAAHLFPNWPRRTIKQALLAMKMIRPEEFLGKDGETLEQCLDLLNRMLELDPAMRITAREALQHPFLASVTALRSPRDDDGDLSVPSFPNHRRRLPGIDDAAYLPAFIKNMLELENARFVEGLEPFKPSSVLSYLLRSRPNSSTSSSFNSSSPHHAVVPSSRPWRNPSRSGSVNGALNREVDNNNNDATGKTATSDINPNHRAILFGWVMELVDLYEMSPRTAFLTCTLVERYLVETRGTVRRANLQLVGGACLHIASKCEDVSYIGAEDLVAAAARAYTVRELLAMEEHVLTSLDFSLFHPTILDFSYSYMLTLLRQRHDARGGADGEPVAMVEPPVAVPPVDAGDPGRRGEEDEVADFLALGAFLSEVALLDLSLSRVRASVVGSAITVYALLFFPNILNRGESHHPPLTTSTGRVRLASHLGWPETLVSVDVPPVITILRKRHAELNTRQGDVLYVRHSRRKYRAISQRFSLAQLAPLDSFVSSV